MAGIYGALNINDNEHATIGAVGRAVVFEAINEVFAQHNADVDAALSVFVEKETENYTERYLLPGGGKLEPMGRQGAPAAVKREGYWDVAYPLRGWGAALGGSRVDMAYLTIQELDAHLKTIMAKDLNTLRWRLLTSLLESDNLSWTDPIHGSVIIRRLANLDGTAYPPVVGSESDADDDHYYGLDNANIDASNNPAEDAVADLVEHFGGMSTYGDPIIHFHHSDETAEYAAIAGYVEVMESVAVALSSSPSGPILKNVPENVPGRCHGRLSGAWLVEWDWMPSAYSLTIHQGAPRPVVMRVDPTFTGLGRGLQLVAKDENYPMESAYYERRFGFGVGNRLNGVAIQKVANTAYTDPSPYNE